MSPFVILGVSSLFCHFHSIPLANNVDPDQMPYYVASDLGLHCLSVINLLQVSRKEWVKISLIAYLNPPESLINLLQTFLSVLIQIWQSSLTIRHFKQKMFLHPILFH